MSRFVSWVYHHTPKSQVLVKSSGVIMETQSWLIKNFYDFDCATHYVQMNSLNLFSLSSKHGISGITQWLLQAKDSWERTSHQALSFTSWLTIWRSIKKTFKQQNKTFFRGEEAEEDCRRWKQSAQRDKCTQWMYYTNHTLKCIHLSFKSSESYNYKVS